MSEIDIDAMVDAIPERDLRATVRALMRCDHNKTQLITGLRARIEEIEAERARERRLYALVVPKGKLWRGEHVN